MYVFLLAKVAGVIVPHLEGVDYETAFSLYSILLLGYVEGILLESLATSYQGGIFLFASSWSFWSLPARKRLRR